MNESWTKRLMFQVLSFSKFFAKIISIFLSFTKIKEVLSALSQQHTVLFYFQFIRIVLGPSDVNETIDPATQHIILNIVRFLLASTLLSKKYE